MHEESEDSEILSMLHDYRLVAPCDPTEVNPSGTVRYGHKLQAASGYDILPPRRKGAGKRRVECATATGTRDATHK